MSKEYALNSSPRHTHLNVEEARPGNVGNRRANLLPRMDHVHPERIHSIPANVVPVDSRDEHLSLVIVHEQSSNHSAAAAASLSDEALIVWLL